MNLKKWRNLSIIFSIILGVILHFVYEWSGKNVVVAAFSSVNESTWEHLKLIFYPMLIIGIIGYFLFGNKIESYIKANTLGIIASISFITIFFYTYSGIIGDNYAILNIGSFVISIIIGEVISYKIIKSNNFGDKTIYFGIIVVLLSCFIIFTYFPPQINYFKDPISGNYGIND